MLAEDTYRTIASPAEAIIKERSSKFLCYAYPVSDPEQVKPLLDALRKKYYDATHHCYAWRIGAKGEQFRINDDGEPSSTAGKPIYGQLLSQDVTDILVVIIRYFGGTKLGVPGLIAAYKDSTVAVLESAEIVERTVDRVFKICFPYVVMNDIMKAVKELQPVIVSQTFDNLCQMTLAIRESKADHLYEKIKEYIIVEK